MSEKRKRSVAEGLALALATFVGIELAKWPMPEVVGWERLAIDFIGGLVGYGLAALALARFNRAAHD